MTVSMILASSLQQAMPSDRECDNFTRLVSWQLTLTNA